MTGVHVVGVVVLERLAEIARLARSQDEGGPQPEGGGPDSPHADSRFVKPELHVVRHLLGLNVEADVGSVTPDVVDVIVVALYISQLNFQESGSVLHELE